MASLTKRNQISLVVATIFCLLAILAAINSKSVMPYMWHVWYGNRMTWNGLEIHLGDYEYFVPNENRNIDLIIGDWSSRDSFIALHLQSRTKEHQEAFIADYCKQGDCRDIRTRTSVTNGRSTTFYSFVKGDHNRKNDVLHEYVIIDGAKAWAEYFGDETRYQEHKQTLETIAKSLLN